MTLDGEEVLLDRPLVTMREVDPLGRPTDPEIKYLRQIRDLLDGFLNEGRLAKKDG